MQLTDILTKSDLKEFEERLLKCIEKFTDKDEAPKRFLRSKQVQELLGISSSTLQNLRVAGVLPFHKIQGILFYKWADINGIIEESKVDFGK